MAEYFRRLDVSVATHCKLPALEFKRRSMDNREDLRQVVAVTDMDPPDPIFANLIRGMHNKLVDIRLPSNDGNSVNIPMKSKNRDMNSSHNKSANYLQESQEKMTESNSDEFENLIDTETEQNIVELPQVPSPENMLYFLPVNYNKRNPWRRIIGLHTAGNDLQSATYPARCSVKKLRFAQAKKPLNYLYSYFSVEIVECDDKSSITVGVCRKDYPSKVAPGKIAGSVGYFSDTGSVFIRGAVNLDGLTFSQGDVIGCGIIYPSHYKRYVDLSTDDNSDGMTDVVLTSLLKTNKKTMDFVCNVLNFNAEENENPSDYETPEELHNDTKKSDEIESYNENFVESRTQVEVYFTHNMRVVGKVFSHIPVGGFYPTVHIFSCSAIRMNVDLNPPTS